MQKSSEELDIEIFKQLLIEYVEENYFINFDEDGNLIGFEVKLKPEFKS